MILTDQVAAVKRGLAEFYTEAEAEVWIATPHRLLGGETALGALRAGGFDRVWALIDQLRSGAYV